MSQYQKKYPKMKLKGYRIRVTVDLPIWDYTYSRAEIVARKIIRNSHTASKIIKTQCIKVGKPDNRELFPEEQPPFNPSKRKS